MENSNALPSTRAIFVNESDKLIDMLNKQVQPGGTSVRDPVRAPRVRRRCLSRMRYAVHKMLLIEDDPRDPLRLLAKILRETAANAT